MFFEAPRKREFITGSEAAKEAVRRSNVDFSVAYPITPQSETMQLIGVLYGEGYVKEYYRGEEEYGVMSAIAGGSRAGVRCFTATAGPGTLRGIEPIASWPGHRLPAVERADRKSTRLNSSHGYISYAVFCLKKKKKKHIETSDTIDEVVSIP